jgi:hypothetical protein
MPKDTLAVITLQYPDLGDGKLRILASTRDRRALLAFREAVLTNAKLRLLNYAGDEVLQLDYQKDYERLQAIFDLLIPVDEQTDNGNESD